MALVFSGSLYSLDFSMSLKSESLSRWLICFLDFVLPASDYILYELLSLWFFRPPLVPRILVLLERFLSWLASGLFLSLVLWCSLALRGLFGWCGFILLVALTGLISWMPFSSPLISFATLRRISESSWSNGCFSDVSPGRVIWSSLSFR